MACVNTEIRLECLKLAVQSCPSNLQEALARAGQFVEFVGQADESEKPKRGRPPKNRDNP